MNIKDRLKCKCCNEIFIKPITLPCGDTVCKHHLDQLISNNSSNKFKCPLCHQESANQSFKVNGLLQDFIEIELHEFKKNPQYKKIFNNLKMEIKKLESILKEPESYIYEETNRLKNLVNLDRESLKSQIDKLADDLIQQLESYEARFKTHYKNNVDFDCFNKLVESSRKHLVEYERCLFLYSVEIEKNEEKFKESQALIETIQPKIKELKKSLFSNVSIKYSQMENNFENLFGKLFIKV
jgi:hypothetical protein